MSQELTTTTTTKEVISNPENYILSEFRLAPVKFFIYILNNSRLYIWWFVKHGKIFIFSHSSSITLMGQLSEIISIDNVRL